MEKYSGRNMMATTTDGERGRVRLGREEIVSEDEYEGETGRARNGALE